MSISIAQYWIQKTTEVPSGSTLIVDTFDTNQFNSANYEIICRGSLAPNENKTRKLKLSVQAVDGDTKDAIWGRTGTGLSLAINTRINGSSIELEVENSNSFDVTFHFARMKLK